MTNVSAWSTSAASNTGAPPAGAPEGMLPGKVNDVLREVQAAVARWYKGSMHGGKGASGLTTAGTGNAYTVTTGSSYTSYDDVPILALHVDRANTGPLTIDVDGLGPLDLYIAGNPNYELARAGDFLADDMMVVAHNSSVADGDWMELVGPMRGAFPSGTAMLFAQTTPPAGWTKSVTHNNKALRLVSGTASSGGSTAFTSVFTSRTIAQANLPSANLSHSLSVGTAITVSNGANVAHASGTTQTGTGGSTDPQNVNTTTVTAVLASGAVSGTVALGGSGTAMDFAVQYVDVVLATKDG